MGYWGGTIRTPTTNSASDVQTSINAAAVGDIVRLNSGSNQTWTAAVEIFAADGIMLDLNGNTITLSGASGEFRINSGSGSKINRVTNGAFIKSGTGYADFSAPIKVLDTRTGLGLRIDNIAFSGSGLDLANGVLLDINGQGAGCLDNCTFTTLFWAQEFVHINGWGAGNTTGWTNDSGATLVGSGLMFFLEGNTCTQISSQLGVSWIQSYYGARLCYRYNIFDHCSTDAHGTPGNVGARWWEIYANTSRNTVGGSNMNYLASQRAGSGVIYSNTVVSGQGNIGLCEEDSGYPADYQIGRGLNQVLDPAYVWSNGGTAAVNSCDAPEAPNMVQVDRDVYWSARPSYTAYTYPHPFTAYTGGGL